MSLIRGYGKIRAGAPYDVVHLYGQVTFGASGAVSSDSDENGAWVFAANATGKYNLTTTELYPELLGATFTHFNNGTVTDNAWQIFRISDSSSLPSKICTRFEIALPS